MMIIAGSAWTGDQIDLSSLVDDSDPDISDWDFEIFYYTRAGDLTYPTDDYGSTICGADIPNLYKGTLDDGAIVVTDEDAAIIQPVLTSANTETMRRNIGLNFSPRLITIQIRYDAQDGVGFRHLLFANEQFWPGASAG